MDKETRVTDNRLTEATPMLIEDGQREPPGLDGTPGLGQADRSERSARQIHGIFCQ